MTREEIKKFIINDCLKKVTERGLNKYVDGKKCVSLKESILEETEYLPKESRIGERIYHILNDMYERPLCPVCKIKYLKFNFNKYRMYCSTKCSGLCVISQKKSKETCSKRYGVEYVFQDEKFKENAKQTNIKKYGVEYPAQNKEIQEKRKQTCLEIYGFKNPFQNEEIKEKIKQTNIKNLGVGNPKQNKEVQEKIKQTNIKNLGCEYPAQNQDVMEKRKQTCLETYGCEYPSQNKEIREKLKNINLEKYISFHRKYLESINLKIIDKYNHCQQTNIFKCLKCGKTFNSCLFIIKNGRRCPYCSTDYNKSNGEIEVYKYLKSILPDTEINQNEKQIIKNSTTNRFLELDIYIPEKKIAIEYNGLYWHSEKFQDKDYHLIKTNLCKEKGIRLIHIFEDEWKFNQDVVKFNLNRILNYNTIGKIIKDKYIIKEINNRLKNIFFHNNDIQRKDIFDINLGIFYKNKLISVMTFIKENEKNIYKLDKFHSSYDYCIYDIADKLLSYFKKNYDWKEIYSYVDLRWSCGLFYEKLGFKLLKQIKPKYWYTKGDKRIHIKSNESNDKIEKDLYSEGYLRIYDCGCLKYQLTNKKE